MSNPPTIVNPFTKNADHMRRNTNGHAWVSSSATSGSGQKHARPNRASPVVLSSDIHYQSQCPDSPIIQPVLGAGIYHADDLQQLPNPYLRIPSFQSWSSFRSGPHNDDSDISPRNRTTKLHIAYDNVPNAETPIYLSRKDEYRKSVNNAEPVPLPSTHLKPQQAFTKPSTVKHVKPNQRCDNSGFYRTAKDIYIQGPKGEGQKLWESYKISRKEKKRQAEVITELPTQPSNRNQCDTGMRKATTQLGRADISKPLPPYPSASTDSKPLPLRPPPTPRFPKDSRPYKNSKQSNVPTQMGQIADASKPLPPVPYINAVPARRPLNNPTINNTHNTTDQKSRPWWKPSSSSKPDKHNPLQSIKGTISRPRPIDPSHTANLATQHGGIGGPGAAAPILHDTYKPPPRPSPPPLHPQPQPPPPSKSHKTKGKQKADPDFPAPPPKHWRRRLVDEVVAPTTTTTTTTTTTSRPIKQHKHSASASRPRQDSDASFVCVGVGATGVQQQARQIRDPGPSKQIQSRLELEIEELFFEEKMMEKEKEREKEREVGGLRDTVFYQAYDDVLREY